MSASPSTPIQSAKRPLEDPSSPSGPTDQPDAKRPALDKVTKGEVDETTGRKTLGDEPSDGKVAAGDPTNGVKNESTDSQGDVVVGDAPVSDVSRTVESSIPSTGDQHSVGNALQHDDSSWIHIRAIISSAEAATVIGKGGENVTLIRKMSGAKCTVSDYQKGAVERILTVSGVVDAAAKVDSHPTPNCHASK
jgi:heterogeneous nuclear rnp K-like protein 2